MAALVTAGLVIVPVTSDEHDPAVAFLEGHIDTSIFLLSGLAQFGPRAGADPLSGNYWRVEERHETVAVFCLTRKGDLLVQAGRRGDLAPAIVEACRCEANPITSVVAEWTIGRSVWDVLVAGKEIHPRYESDKLLYGLRLSESPSAGSASDLGRRLVSDDFDQWDRLYTAHMKEEGAPVSDSPDDRARTFHRMLASGRSWWGAFEGTELAAIVALNASYKTAGQIAGLYTREDKRRRGYARAVTIRAMNDCWHDAAIRRLVLLVNDDNTAARHLYESLGFVASDRFGFLFGRTSAE
jgi:predicted GNAT family acetyltransferase